MVRNLVGTFVLVGKGSISLADFERILRRGSARRRDRPRRRRGCFWWGWSIRARGILGSRATFIRCWHARSSRAYTACEMATDVQFAVSRIASVNPATGEVLGELESAGPAEVRAAVARGARSATGLARLGRAQPPARGARFQQLLLGARPTSRAASRRKRASRRWRRWSRKCWWCSMPRAF